jgi:hypothetical protein
MSFAVVSGFGLYSDKEVMSGNEILNNDIFYIT